MMMSKDPAMIKRYEALQSALSSARSRREEIAFKEKIEKKEEMIRLDDISGMDSVLQQSYQRDSESILQKRPSNVGYQP